jgi:two-component system, OmpR family, response regulator
MAVPRPRVLVVEDDNEVLAVLAMSLRQAGFRVSTARQRRRALAILRRGGIDLIVADSVLSGGNGEALAAQTELPVILISGHPERIERLTGGPIPFLAKPFSTNRLLFVVQEMLAHRSQQE